MLTTVMLRCLKGGVEIMLRLRFDPAQTLDDIETGRATHFPGVPTMFIAMAAQPGLDQRDLSSLRIASCGGAPLPVEVAQRFEALTGRRVGDTVRLDVTDSGPGVDPRDVERIFEKFFQSGPRPRESSGAGLGLSIARGLVESMQGEISAENRAAGSGLRVTLSLPAAP